MGFLGDLIGNFVKKEASDMISDAVNKTIGNVVSSNNQRNNYNSDNNSTYKRNDSNLGGGEDGFRERFESIIAQEYSEYELVKNVSAYDFGADEGAREYSYGLYYNGQPKLMIMIIRDNNGYRRSDVLKARRACEAKGISYLNFMVYFPNEYNYIADRIRNVI